MALDEALAWPRVDDRKFIIGTEQGAKRVDCYLLRHGR